MKTRYIILLFISAFIGMAAFKNFNSIPVAEVTKISAITPFTPAKAVVADTSTSWLKQESKVILAQASNLNPEVLKLGLTAYLKARKQGIDDKQLLTIVDYSKPSNERRLWVVDLKNEKVLFNTYVAHGKNSGDVNTTSFSNQPSSLKTSLGVFATNATYEGHNGLSLRLQGLEPGFNDNALRRDIVVHGAWYAGADVAKSRGMLGRSWGCPAVDQKIAKPLINTIKDNTVVVAYYPDKNWLKKSAFVNYQSA